MITFKCELQCKTFLTALSTLEGKGKGTDSPLLLTLSKDKEQRAESYDKEHSELFLTWIVLTTRYLNEKYETPSVKIRQMFNTTTKTKPQRLCYQHNLQIHREVLEVFK